jgi:CcmD family protein
MNSLHYLYAAYIATWAIHGTYLWILARKAGQLKKEMEKLKKAVSTQHSPLS